jgi:HEAT repeat protein
MEFAPSSTTEESYLDKDDINGPGVEKYVKRTGDKSVDFALYKISQYSASTELSERIKFAKELEELALQLGSHNISSLFNVLTKLVRNKQAEDSIEVKAEVAFQIPLIGKVLSSEFNLYSVILDQLIPFLGILLDDKNQDVLKAACTAATSLAGILTKDDRSSSILTMILRILHDEEEETRIRALSALKDLVGLLSPDVCECFVIKEVMILSSENVVKIRKAVAECIPKLTKVIKQPESTEKLIKVFKELSKDSIWGVRKACVENISEMFEGLDETTQEFYLMPVFEELLSDKSNSVKQAASLQLGPSIFYCKIQLPEGLLTQYIDLAWNTSNKGEFQYHFSYYLPGVLLKLGKKGWDRLSSGFFFILREGDTRCKKCLISSIKEIGKVLEAELATADIARVYESIFSDTNQSKQLAMTSFAKFLSVILPESRLEFIKHLKIINKNTSNWRIRLSISEQIYELIQLFDTQVVLSELFPIISTLINDKIAKVRESASLCMGKLIDMVLDKDEKHSIIEDFRSYAYNQNFAIRQAFAIACQVIIHNKKFCEVFGKDIIKLSSEKAPNLRLCCAKVIRLAKENTQDDSFWKSTEEKLSRDFDADVRFEISGKYDVQRGVSKLRPNLKKASEITPPMFRALFPDDDLHEIINFNNKGPKVLKMLKNSVTPAMNGFVEDIKLKTVNKNKLLIEA